MDTWGYDWPYLYAEEIDGVELSDFPGNEQLHYVSALFPEDAIQDEILFSSLADVKTVLAWREKARKYDEVNRGSQADDPHK